MDRRVDVCGKVKGFRPEAVAKASVNSALKYCGVDPKASDLTMARVKRM